MRSIFIFLFILSYARLLSSQNSPLDSLSKYSYLDLESKFYGFDQIDKIKEAQLVAQYYLQKAKTEKNIDKIEEGYVLMHFNETLPKALKYLDSLQSITRLSKKNTYPARVYLLKGNLFFRFDHGKEALDNYILGLKYAKEKGNKRQIAFADISIAYLNNYIGKHSEAAKKLRYYLFNAPYLSESELSDIHLNLTSTYLDLEKMDSAQVFINEGLMTSKSKDNIYRYNEYLSLLGLYQLKQKKYQEAINNLSKCTEYLTKTQASALSISYATLYLGKSYAGLGQKEKAVESFMAIDSIFQKTNNTFPELREAYSYLIQYFKEKNDKEKQLYYIDRFIKVHEKLDSQFRYIAKELPKQYDVPNLIKEKENIISNLKNRKKAYYLLIGVLVLLLLFVIYLFYRSKKSEKKYRKIAQELLQSVYEKPKIDRSKDSVQNNSSSSIQSNDIEDKVIRVTSEDIAQEILEELNTFETNELFLQKGITLSSLAKQIRTNSRYLSEVINIYKGKNFATYLNDLRIDYAIRRLANDKRFRSYKIPFIAEGLGYNNEQAFAMAFKKRTGTPVSIYLKEIEKMKDLV
ncbi:helix-turn-helix domain-containing protein [Elizabethkingia anophelis]|uniref:helix-turn-helix domain-containing protein n=1 Tax=Elizabethkingia anophelis TaxID=1117645 RepID=UPI003892789D